MTAVEAAQASASFAAGSPSVPAARRFVADLLQRWGAHDVADDAVLLVSELVTNAVVHAGTRTDVRCALSDAGLRIEVVDRYPGRSLPPVVTTMDTEAEGGRGLAMTAILSGSWGVSYASGSKRVWFQLRRGADASDEPASTGTDLDDDLVTATSAPLEVEELLRRAVDRAREVVDAEVVVAYLLAQDDEALVLRASAGAPIAALPDVPARDAATVPLVLRGPDESRPGSVEAVLADGTRLPDVVTAPLLVEGQLVGVLGAAAGAGRLDEVAAARLALVADRVALAVQSARVVELERQRRGWVAFLAEASDLLGGTLQHDMILALVGHLVVPRLATWCAVYLDHDDGTRVLASAVHAAEHLTDPLRDLLASAAAPPRRHSGGARAWRPEPLGEPSAQDADAAQLVAGLAEDETVEIPLLARGRTLGSVVLGRPPAGRFRREVLDLAEDLTRRAALALDNARLYRDREDTARALQASLLPPALPDIGFLDVGVAYAAAGGHDVGGDFYDVFALREDRWGFAVGDVCGKGPEAAAVTGLARQALRLLSREDLPVAQVLPRLNAAILDEGARSRFLTVVAGQAQARPDGVVRLRLVCAGHPLPVLVPADGSGPRLVGTSQPLLGVLDEVVFDEDVIDLAPGDALVCVTDGVTERRSDALGMIGERGLLAILRGATGDASAVAAQVQRQVLAWAPGAPRDDLAVLVLRARGA